MRKTRKNSRRGNSDAGETADVRFSRVNAIHPYVNRKAYDGL